MSDLNLIERDLAMVDRAGFTPLVVTSAGSGDSFVLHAMAGRRVS